MPGTEGWAGASLWESPWELSLKERGGQCHQQGDGWGVWEVTETYSKRTSRSPLATAWIPSKTGSSLLLQAVHFSIFTQPTL